MSGWRRLRMGMATLLGLAPQGFFIPYRYAATLPRPGFRGRLPAVEDLFRRAEPSFHAWLDALDSHRDAVTALGRGSRPDPRWDQMWFPRLDGAMAYTIARSLRPRRIVEIGGGHSTRFLARAVKDAGAECRHIVIDPSPRARLDGLAIEHINKPLAQAGMDPFSGLAAGDILFVDSSHILVPGSDVDVLLNHFLPQLPPGVMVHFHDIFLPDDYPVGWAWRGYNEQQGVAALLHGQAFRPVFSSRYVITRMPGRFAQSAAARLPFVPGSFEASLWMLKEK
jgi:hypothetical protein